MLTYNEWFDYILEPEFTAFRSTDLTFRAHMHKQFEILFVLEGKIKVKINNEGMEMSRNDACVVLSNGVHSYDTEENSQVMIVIFEPLCVLAFSKVFKNKSPLSHFIHHMPDEMRHLFFMLLDAHQNNLNQLILYGYLHIILGHVVDMLDMREDYFTEGGMVQSVLAFVEQNQEKRLSLDQIAKKFGISKYQVSRIFNHKVGCSFNNYINLLRINKARQLFLTDMTITQIAYDCGFESVRTFYRAFKKICHLTPMQYRDSLFTDRQ